MAAPDNHRDIEVNEDLVFQRKEWRFQRIGWVVMLLITAAALAGAFGRGPLAHTQNSASDQSFRIEYDRIVRHYSNNIFEIRIEQPPADSVGIWFDSEFLSGLDLKEIVPEPISSATGRGRVIYYFRVQPGAHISFHYEPDKFGRRNGTMGIEHRASVRLSQFVFP